MTAAAPLDHLTQLGVLRPLVGVVQMTSSPDKEATFAQLTALTERAKARGAQVTAVYLFYNTITSDTASILVAYVKIINGIIDRVSVIDANSDV